MGRSDDDPVKPSDLSEAEREALKRQYRGVFWDRKTKRWRCQLGYQSKKIFLGYFDDAGEAARAYDQKLVELRGAGARTNFPITEYLDLMPTPTKRGGAGAAAVAAAAAAAANREGAGMDEDENEDDGEEIDQPSHSGRNGAAAAAGYAAETPSLDPAYPAGAGGRLGGLLDGSAGVGGCAGGSSSPRHGLSHLPAIAPLSTDLPGDPHHAALAAQDYDMAGEEDLAAAAQLAIEIRRSFDGSNFKWQHQQQQYGGLPPQLATATSTGSAGGSAAAAAAAGYAGRGGEYDLHQRAQQQQQQQPGGAYRDETAAAAAAGYGGNASLYGSYGHHNHAVAAHHHHHQQQHYAQHHGHLRNGSTPGDMYGSSQGWADPAAAAAAAGGPFEGHPGYGAHGNSHYPHHSAHHHHSHSGLAGGHGGYSDTGCYAGYSMHQQQSHHAAAAAAAAAGYGHHAHHAQHYQQQHARHYQHQLYHQQQQQGAGAGFYPGDGEDQHMAHAGHMQQQHYHAQHQHQQQAHGHFPLHHSHSYPGAVGREGMDGAAAAAGYYGHGAVGPTYTSHAEAVAAHRLSHAHSSGQFPSHHAALHHQQQQEHFAAAGPHSRSGGDLASAQGVYGSSGDLQQHYGGGLAAAQQPGQQYDARAAASNPPVTAADYRQRLATYGLHGYASDAGEYGGGAGMDAEGHRGYAGNHMQHYQQQHEHQQQQMQAEADLAGATAMDAAGPGGAGDPYGSQQQAAYQTEDPWIQSRGFGRVSAAGDDGGLADVAAAEGLPTVKTTRASGRTSRATNRGAAAAAVDSDDYDAEDDDDYGSDSDTGRGRGRNSRRRSRAQAAAGGHSNGDNVLRTKQRTGDGGDDERGHSYRGVFWDKKSRRWRCQLGHKNKKIFLGYFGVAEDAARAYDQKLVELHGGAAKTNFPIQNYLGGGTVAGSKDNSAAAAAAVAESPRAPGGPAGGADVPGRRRSSHAGDASAKASQAQHSELSWGALGLPRSSRLSHDASEGAPRLSWAGVDTLSSWDQQHPDSQYAKRRRLMEGGGQLPTSPQEYGALTSGLHSHQAVGCEDMMSPTSMARQSSGYRVVETPSVQPNLAGRHSGTGQPAPAPSFDAAAMAAGILPSAQQLPSPIGASGRNSSLTLSRLASGEVGAVQALSGLHALGGRSNSGPAGLAQAAAAAGSGSLERASSGVPVLTGSAAANAVLAAAGAGPAATAGGLSAGGALQQQQLQQSQASRLFEEAVHQYGGRPSGSGLPAGPSAVSAVAVGGRVSDPNTGASSSTATPPSALTAGGHFGGHGGTSPQDATAAAALSRLNSSEVRAVQALSGIHNDVLPYQSRAGMHAGGMRQQQQQQGYMTPAVSAPPQPAPSPASITETVAQELLCRAPVVSAVASSSIAAVAAAAAAAAAAKGSAAEAATAAVVARNSADGSFSGLVGEMAAGLGDGRLRAMTPPNAVNTERLSTPGLSPLITGSMLLPPPPPLQLQFDGQDLGGDSLPGTASAAAAAAAAVGIANAGRALGASAGAGADPSAASAKVLSHIDPGDAFAAEAGWGGLDDLLMPKKRPSCSGNSGLIGLLENIGQFKNEADAAAEAVAVPQQQQQQQHDAASEEQQQAPEMQEGAPAAGSAAAVGASTAEDASQQPAQQQQEASAQPAAPAAPLKAETAAATAGPAAAAAAAAALMPAAAAAAALSGPSQGLPSGPVSFMTPTAEPMAVLP